VYRSEPTTLEANALKHTATTTTTTIHKTAEVCEILRVGMSTLRQMIMRREIAVIRSGRVLRISQAAIDEWVRKHECASVR
jgi:excisionase family DNA binding protein